MTTIFPAPYRGQVGLYSGNQNTDQATNGWSTQDELDYFTYLEGLADEDVTIPWAQVFVGRKGATWLNSKVLAHIAAGRKVVITIGYDPYTKIDASYLNWLTTQAGLVAAANKSIGVRLWSEMNGHQRIRAYGDGAAPANFVRAWKQAYAAIKAGGGAHCEVMWIPTEAAFKPKHDIYTYNNKTYDLCADNFWPDGDHVDVIGLDSYNWTSGANPSFSALMLDFQNWAAKKGLWRVNIAGRAVATGKPWVICETGSFKNARDAGWVSTIDAGIKPNFALVLYFDEYKIEDGTVHDWRLSNSVDDGGTPSAELDFAELLNKAAARAAL